MLLRKTDILILLVLLFPICNLVGGLFDYYDEIIGLISLFYIINRAIKRKLTIKQLRIIHLLLFITLIGVLSNSIFHMASNLFAIVIDILWLWKIYAVYLAAYHICLSIVNVKSFFYRLCFFAKCILVFMMSTAIICQFWDIGVSGPDRLFGFLRQYSFFWNNGIQTGWLVMCCIMPISVVYYKGKKYRLFFLLSIMLMVLTTSALVYCWVFVALALTLMLKKDREFKWWYFAIIGLGVILFAWADIQEYFLRGTSGIRLTLLKYGAITANKFFPLGSGFATYGSDMAARFYSKLYSSYGWENTWALGRETGRRFLNDNFYASIIGQFGWIGFALYLAVVYLVFSEINTKRLPKRARVTALATIITIAVVMIASASAKSMMGVCSFAVLGLLSSYSNNNRTGSYEFKKTSINNYSSI